MFLLRSAQRKDRDALLELADLLDSPNLPRDPHLLEARIERSANAFANPAPPDPQRVYQFVLVDASDRPVGSSAVISKHGTPELPHVYLRVGNEARVARKLEVAVEHCTLQLAAERDGPSELGALILHPDMRGQPGWPGKLLSWGRFTYMALHSDRFETRVLAEMRPSFDAEGQHAFWHAFGQRFTHMEYDEADRLSSTDKSFILELFPSVPFYASLLDEAALAELGQVHPAARAALRLLEQAGLRWIGEIDPFDAGPFYGAPIAKVIPIEQTQTLHLAAGEPADDAPACIIASEEGGDFRALACRAETSQDELRLSKEAIRRLGASRGDPLTRTPLPHTGTRHG